MPPFRPPRPPRLPRLLTRQGEALAASIQRLAPEHRDIVARVVQALQPPRDPPAEPPRAKPTEHAAGAEVKPEDPAPARGLPHKRRR